MAELKYEIVENLGSLGENARGWSKELNLITHFTIIGISVISRHLVFSKSGRDPIGYCERQKIGRDC